MSTRENLDDLIFRHRNREYGAYYLRQHYLRYLLVALAIGVTLFVLPFIIPYLIPEPEEEIVQNRVSMYEWVAPPPKKEIMPEDVVPKTVKKKQKNTFFIPIVAIDPGEEVDLIIEPNSGTSDTTAGNITNGSNNGVIEGSGVNDEGIFTYVEEPPLFPGGEQARTKFLQRSVIYPHLARQYKIQGVVYVTFVVEKDGSLTNVKILQGIGGGCDEEAMRVIYTMPRWTPGRRQGHEVRVQVVMPIKFVLQAQEFKG